MRKIARVVGSTIVLYDDTNDEISSRDLLLAMLKLSELPNAIMRLMTSAHWAIDVGEPNGSERI